VRALEMRHGRDAAANGMIPHAEQTLRPPPEFPEVVVTPDST